ncbi:hypothetical protein JAAARDRAFT_140360 [Jaapia argillacea MUCL 33604]|uniref:Aldehyde dehydrogenase domain-containing protein n=1 Tax=Jaapia argillacea MUCL 33604 TaxID=933084 RepID=A0A067P9D5_9AGAM|nr:hypothetical protein JAAARDRAFT_140360 [Jaapia argillacea MUCL 33604]
MVGTFSYKFDTPTFKGTSTFPTGLFINGKFVDPVEDATIDVINPTNAKVIGKVAIGSSRDVDIAVKVAQDAFDKSWGLNVAGSERGKLLWKLADLMEQNADELAALEALDVGKAYSVARNFDINGCIATLRYYAGWSDKDHGQTIETDENKLAYTRHEPIGVVGQIIPWNLPLVMMCWKIGPALATGNTIVLKPSEVTPLSALRMCSLVNEAGYPAGVVNIINGLGSTVGQAMSEHMGIEKIAFTGSTVTGRKIMEAAARTNLKNVTLELGGKSPNIIFDDAEIEQAVKWAAHGIYFNHGQACAAGSRIFVQAGIYDEFMKRFTAHSQALTLGDPFEPTTYQGPQVSQTQFDRIMNYIDSGKKDGAKVHIGGGRHGSEGYFIQPTIFTNCRPEMKIVKEEIFGPVAVVIKFTDEEDVVRQANDTAYGLASAIFTQNINLALRVAHKIQAGTVWINCTNFPEVNVPFGGYKQSGIGRELGEYALRNYTAVKAVHVNLGHKM